MPTHLRCYVERDGVRPGRGRQPNLREVDGGSVTMDQGPVRRGPATDGRTAGLTTTRSARSAAIDTARGLAITMVVAGHVLRGLRAAGLATEAVFATMDLWLYSFRMPAFAFLAALFIKSGTIKYGDRSYVARRARDLMWVYVIWSLLQGVFEVALSGRTNSPTSWTEVLALWSPRAQFWYLPFLLVASCLMVAIKPWRSHFLAVLSVVVAFGVSWLTWQWNYRPFGLMGAPLLSFVMLGAAVSVGTVSRVLERTNAWWLVGASAASTALLTLIVLRAPVVPATGFFPVEVTAATRTWGLVAGLIGIVLLFSFAAVISRTSAFIQTMSAYLGRHSLVIYLAHILCAAGTRETLEALGVSSAAVHIVAGMGAGMTGPLLLAATARHVPIVSWLLTPPSDRTSNAGSPAASAA